LIDPSLLADGVEVRPRDGGVYLVRGDVAVAIDDHVLRAIAGDEAGMSRPFRDGALLPLGRLGMLRDGDSSEPPRPAVASSGPGVDVVIPNLNGGDRLRRALASLAQQEYEPVSVIVVDGGSTDESKAIAAKYGAQWLEVPSGSGFATTCNAGAAAGSGTYILLLNNDVELEPDFIAQIVAVAEQGGSDVAAVAPMVRRGDIRCVVESLGNVLGTRGFGAGRLAGLVDVGQFSEPEELFGVPFTAGLVRRSVWDELGPMDERFDFYYEDVEWSTRVRLAGYDLLSAPQAIAYHEGSASLGQGLGPAKLEMVTRNRVLWATSSLRAKTIVRFAGSYAREDALRAGSALREGDLEAAAAIARAWGGVARRLPATYRRRRSTLANHVLPMRGLLEIARAPAPFYDEQGAVLVTEPVVRAWYLRVAARQTG
jgi:N-acetylglucosaminyl-diphospho-decaprenol L-rhamnosyltransferase